MDINRGPHVIECHGTRFLRCGANSSVQDFFSPPRSEMSFIDFKLSKECAKINRENGYSPVRKNAPGTTTDKKFYGLRTLEKAEKWDEFFDRFFMINKPMVLMSKSIIDSWDPTFW